MTVTFQLKTNAEKQKIRKLLSEGMTTLEISKGLHGDNQTIRWGLFEI